MGRISHTALPRCVWRGQRRVLQWRGYFMLGHFVSKLKFQMQMDILQSQFYLTPFPSSWLNLPLSLTITPKAFWPYFSLLKSIQQLPATCRQSEWSSCFSLCPGRLLSIYSVSYSPAALCVSWMNSAGCLALVSLHMIFPLIRRVFLLTNFYLTWKAKLLSHFQ